MLELAIKGGKMKITDDNQTIVSKSIADEINKNLEAADAEGIKKPELVIIEDKK